MYFLIGRMNNEDSMQAKIIIYTSYHELTKKIVRDVEEYFNIDKQIKNDFTDGCHIFGVRVDEETHKRGEWSLYETSAVDESFFRRKVDIVTEKVVTVNNKFCGIDST